MTNDLKQNKQCTNSNIQHVHRMFIKLFDFSSEYDVIA